MALPKKPKKTTTPTEQDISALINKGGSTPQDVPQVPTIKQFPLRFPQQLYDRIQKHGKSRVPTKTVTTFVIEAILEKLDRDEK